MTTRALLCHLDGGTGKKQWIKRVKNGRGTIDDRDRRLQSLLCGTLLLAIESLKMSFSVSSFSHQFCIQAAMVWGNPAFSPAPDVASFPAPPAGRLWSLPPTDAPSVTSYTDTEKNNIGIL